MQKIRGSECKVNCFALGRVKVHISTCCTIKGISTPAAMDGWSIFYGALLILLLAIVISFAALLHAGLFIELRIRTTKPLPEACPKRVAYKLYRGPYKNAGKAYTELLDIVPNLRHFGIYYDDPNKVSGCAREWAGRTDLRSHSVPGSSSPAPLHCRLLPVRPSSCRTGGVAEVGGLQSVDLPSMLQGSHNGVPMAKLALSQGGPQTSLPCPGEVLCCK